MAPRLQRMKIGHFAAAAYGESAAARKRPAQTAVDASAAQGFRQRSAADGAGIAVARVFPFVLCFSAGARLPVLLCVIFPAAEIADVFKKIHFVPSNAAAVAADSRPFLKGPVKACFVDYRAAERGFAYALQSFGKFQVFYTAAVFKRGSAYAFMPPGSVSRLNTLHLKTHSRRFR